MTSSPPTSATKPPAARTVYVGDDSEPVARGVSGALRAHGVKVYIPSGSGDPERVTASIGSFRCALLHLDRHDGNADAIDSAELLRVYQPSLPVAFLHENAAERMLQRGRALGPLFHVPSDLPAALAWALVHADR